MKNNDKTTGNLAKKKGGDITEIKNLQAKIQIKPKNLKLGKSVPVLFKEKMLEKLKKNAKNNIYYIDTINLPELRNLADAVCEEIETEKVHKHSNGNVDRAKLKTNYNLIETFIWYLFVNNKFKPLQNETKLSKQKTKNKDDITKQFEKPIVQYLKPYFEESKFATGPSMPDIISDVFTNFCVACRKADTGKKLYNINQKYIPEEDKGKTKGLIENSRRSSFVTTKLQKYNKLQKGGKRNKHTLEMIQYVISTQESKQAKDNNTTKTVIFNPTATKHTSEQKNNEEQINIENNNNNLSNDDINIEEDINIANKPKINNKKNTKIAMFNAIKQEDNNINEEKSLNRKRKPIQVIEDQQNKTNKKFKHIDNNNLHHIKIEFKKDTKKKIFDIDKQKSFVFIDNGKKTWTKLTIFEDKSKGFILQKLNKKEIMNMNDTKTSNKNSAFQKK